MKFKNYRNSYNNDDRIYSSKEIYNMSLGEILKNKEMLLSQYRVLGVPTKCKFFKAFAENIQQLPNTII